MQNIGREHGRELAHGTYKHIKVTLSAIFTDAKRKGLFDGANPVQGVSIPKGKKHGRKRLTYSLAEIEQHLDLFKNDPILIVNGDGSTYAPKTSVRLIRAVIGVAAFACRTAGGRNPWFVVGRRRVVCPQHSAFGLAQRCARRDEDSRG